MKFSIEKTDDKMGKGLKAEAHITKGSCFLDEACFCFTDLWNKKDDYKRISSVGAGTAGLMLVMRALAKYEHDPAKLEQFVADHHGGTRPMETGVFPFLKRIAETYKKDCNFVTRLYCVFTDNAFATGFPLQTRFLESYVYNKASYANHRCLNNNAIWTIDSESGRMKFFAICDIAPGDWITIPYLVGTHKLDADARRRKIMENMGFKCMCPDCVTCIAPKNVTVFGAHVPQNHGQYVAFTEFAYGDIEKILLQHHEILTRDVIACAIFFEHFRAVLGDAIDEAVPAQKSVQWKPFVDPHAAQTYSAMCAMLLQRFDVWGLNETTTIFSALCGQMLLTQNTIPALSGMLRIMATRHQTFGINEHSTFALVIGHFLGQTPFFAKMFGMDAK